MSIKNKIKTTALTGLAALVIGCARFPLKTKAIEHIPSGIKEVTRKITKQDGISAESTFLAVII